VKWRFLQQVTGLAHNSRVFDANADPPNTLSAAEEKFKTFLAIQNYPTTICWLMPGDVVADKNRHFWVRKRGAETTKHATLQYSVGLERNVGVELEAICATETETFAAIFIPEDAMEAQRYLMGRGLKLTCPMERIATSAVTNPLKWKLVWWWNMRRSRLETMKAYRTPSL
jgi:hypothetical protein